MAKENTKKKKGTTKQNKVSKTNTEKNQKTNQNNKKEQILNEKKINDNKKTKNEEKDNKRKTIERAKRDLVYAKSENDEISKLVKIILAVTAIMIVFYFITTVVTRKANAVKTAKKTKEESKIQYDNIMIGTMLNKEGTYYVLIEKEDDENISEYKTLVQTASVNEESPKIYTANLTDSFNKPYLADESNYDTDLSNFKVKSTTLVKISDHNVEKTLDNYEDIKNELSELQ